VDKCKTFLML
jgi:hypothetical protein